MLRGDPPLFPSREEVELSWEVVDPVIDHWESTGHPEKYRAGTWGLESADEMLRREARSWRLA